MPFHMLLDDTQLFYTDSAADGPTMLFVHGWTCDSHDWACQIAEFAGEFRVIAPDLRGHGRSTVARDGYTPGGFAADLSALLRALSATPAIVIGHSLGGAVAASLAVGEPDLVRATIAVDPSYGPADAELDLDELFAALRSPDCHLAAAAICADLEADSTPAGLVAWHQRRAAGTPPEVIAATAEGLVNESGGIGPTSHFLLRRAVPVLAFHRDRRNAAWEAATLPDDGQSKVVLWEGAGHRLHQERPADFNHVLREWISRLAPLPGIEDLA